MEKVERYRQIVQNILRQQAHPYAQPGEVEAQVICDTEHDHYQLCYVGWQEYKRIFGLILHFDIKDGKVWVQYNGTELAIAQMLVEAGVPPSDIVLGFRHAYKRPYTGYAVS